MANSSPLKSNLRARSANKNDRYVSFGNSQNEFNTPNKGGNNFNQSNYGNSGFKTADKSNYSQSPVHKSP